MIKVNIYDNERIYSHSLEVSEYGAMPINSTTKNLPELTGEQVAIWTDIDWDILEQRPEIIISKVVPQSITMRQCRLALLAKDLLTVVENAIAEMNDKSITIEWEYATTIQRDNALVNSLCTQLEMSSEDIDNLFIYAEAL
jgi:hypothetical protein